MYTSSKKDINHIAIILKDDETHEVNVNDVPTIPGRRAAAEKNRVSIFLLPFPSILSFRKE